MSPASSHTSFGAFTLHGKIEFVRISLLSLAPKVLQKYAGIDVNTQMLYASP